jgi:methyltransferase (TIGR00027 family)
VLTSADTAYAIAAIRALERERPDAERLFDDPYAAAFAAAGAHTAEGTRRFMELPFFVDGVRLRTRSVDDFVREGVAAGLRQVVALGAGFDMRGLRLIEPPAMFFEVDRVALLEQKCAILADANVRIPAHVKHVACDFSTRFEASLARDLAAAGFRAGTGALFIWEGVLWRRYLPGEPHENASLPHVGMAFV